MTSEPKRKTILVANDDGIFATGIKALALALKPLGDVYVVAPEMEQSGVGHGITFRRPLRFKHTESAGFGEIPAYRVDGTPADCVALGIRLLPRPDLVVSGINLGQNLGDDFTHSGTVSAAVEGVHNGIPAIAFSQMFPPGGDKFDFTNGARYAARVAAMVLEHRLPARTVLSVNFPHGVPKGVRVTELSDHGFDDNILEREDPSGQKYYWVDGTPHGHGEPFNDLGAVKEGFISVTPVQLEFTAREYMKVLEGVIPALEGRD